MRHRIALPALVALCLLLASIANAVPTLRTYRGVSPYRALAEGGLYPEPSKNSVKVLDPKRKRHPKENWDPRLVPGLIRHPYGGRYTQRPRWANNIVKKTRTTAQKVLAFASRIGLDLVRLADISNPEGQWDAAIDLAHGEAIWQSLDFESGNTVILANGTVIQKGADGGLPNLDSIADSGFDYVNTPVRGVNIGNWLIAEFWMDPQYGEALNNHAVNAPYPNAIVDEWTAGQYSNYDYQAQVFKGHYDSWFGEADMKAIAAAGLNHVRIPFPFWAFLQTNRANEPYRTWNQFDKLIQAVGWAKTYGLKVWIDFHGVPGSQNGYDNSGHAGGIYWTDADDNISRTKYTFARLVHMFAQDAYQGVVTAFEAVNEPQGHNSAVLAELQDDYYPWSLGTVKDASDVRLQVTHDAFLTPGFWQNYYSSADAKRVILDTHPYFVYTDYEHSATDSQRIVEVCQLRANLTTSKQHYITVAGEMSTSAPLGDNGFGRDLPTQYFKFPSGPSYPYSAAYMNFLAFNFRVQQSVFEGSKTKPNGGWIYWAWYNKADLDWSYKTGIQYGWLPANASQLNATPLGTNPCSIVGQ